MQVSQMMISCCCSMADWYMKAAQEGESEQSRLARILDLAQDLKVRDAVQLSGIVPDPISCGTESK
jgi:hypothetical protein